MIRKDVTVVIHLMAGNPNPVDLDILKHITTRLVTAVYGSEVREVVFDEGSPNRDGVNALQIRTTMDKATKDHLQDAFSLIFEQQFEVSINDVSDTVLNRRAEIEAVAQRFKPRRIPAPRP